MGIVIGFVVGAVVTLVAVGLYYISNIGFNFDFGDIGSGKMR